MIDYDKGLYVVISSAITLLVNQIYRFYKTRIDSKKANADISKTDSDVKNSDFDTITKGYKEFLESAKNQFKDLQEKYHDLNQKFAVLTVRHQEQHRELTLLRGQLAKVERTLPNVPVPMWFKDHNGMMLSLNDSYEDVFLKPQNKVREDYIGFYDDKIWGEEVANVFKKNDDEAAEKGELSYVVEHKVLDNYELLKDWAFFKYPRYMDGIVVGIGGIAIPMEDLLKKQ